MFVQSHLCRGLRNTARFLNALDSSWERESDRGGGLCSSVTTEILKGSSLLKNTIAITRSIALDPQFLPPTSGKDIVFFCSLP